MKRIITYLLLLISVSVYAQETPPPVGANFKQLSTGQFYWDIPTQQMWVYKGVSLGWHKIARGAEIEASYYNQSVRDIGGKGVFLLLGDSFTTGTGASAYTNSYSYIVGRSIMNSYPGYGYATVVNQNVATTAGTGITTTGTYLTTGAISSRLQLTAGQVITITNRNAKYFDVIYDGAVSSGSLEFRLNGNLLFTKTISGTTLNTTFPTIINSLNTRATDVVTITSTGTSVITAINTIREASPAAYGYILGKSGSAYQDYTSTAILDEMAYYLNSKAGKKTLILALGTNNLYSGSKSLSPTNTVTQATLVINGIKARCVDVDVVITIPAKSNEAVYPIVASGFTYQNYVDALLAFCTTNGYVPVRYDKTQLGTGSTTFMSDNVHPNDNGHKILANKINETLGIVTDAGNGNLLPPAGSLVTSITGTTSQVIASASTGDVTLSLPQSIATGNNVQFNLIGLGITPTHKVHISGAVGSNLYNLITNGTQTGLFGISSANNILGGALSNHDFLLFAGATEKARLFATGNFGIGTGAVDAGFKLNVNGTAWIQNKLTLATGTTAIAPLNIPTGVLTTTAANGNIEFDGTNFYGTIGTTRAQLNNGAANGTVTSVTSANTDIAVATGTTTPVLTLNSGSGANQIAKRDAGGLIAGVVPYTGATGTVNLGSNAFLSGSITSTVSAGGSLGVVLSGTPGTYASVEPTGYSLTSNGIAGYTSYRHDGITFANANVSSGTYNQRLLHTPLSLSSNSTLYLPNATAGTLAVIGTTAPASATDTGVVGEIRVTSTYIYTCIAVNTWVRAALATW